jgi:hypothetical protein
VQHAVETADPFAADERDGDPPADQTFRAHDRTNPPWQVTNFTSQ